MLNREKFDNEIAILESVASKHENDDFRTMVEKIKNLREQFEVKIMMIGHFNAGKSALLNCLIQRDDFLTEAQVPQTAVATELKFSENENYFAHMNDGSMVKLQNHNDFSPQSCDHVEYQIPAANLKRLSDFTFVDTPGFDSGVDAHNKALSAYIGQGAAYILVCDIGKGGLSENTIAFLNEISQYSKRIAIVLNKTDIHIDEDNEQVLEEVIDTLHINGYDFPVITTSKFDEKAEEKIMCLIDSFCAQDVFDEKMRKSIESETSNMKNVLTVAQKNLHVDTYDLDLKIKKYQEAYDYLQESFEKQKNNFESEVPQITEQIITDIRNELNAKSYDVAKALSTGGTTGLEAIVVEIVRPVMIASMKQVAHQHLDAIVKTIDFSPLLNVEETKEVGGIVVNLASGIRDLIDNGSFVKAISVFERKDDKNQKKEGVDGKQIYQIATGIAAIATDIIAPWMEVVIILLPNIISLCQALFGETSEERMRAIFINNIIPQITVKLYDPINKAVQNSYQLLIENMSSVMNSKLDSMNQILLETKDIKETKLLDFDSHKKILAEQISELDNLKAQLGR